MCRKMQYVIGGNMKIAEAEEILLWANSRNPGPWSEHSRMVSKAAVAIAKAVGLDAGKAGVYGLLHDIGRYMGVTSMMHIYDGYKYFMEKGCPDIAQICITHSFPINDISFYSGANDCSVEIYEEIKGILKVCEYTDYDYLIQLCDSIALPEGICLLEKRLIDVAMRHGINETTQAKWKKLFEIKEDFEKRMGKSIYELFPEAVANTFN